MTQCMQVHSTETVSPGFVPDGGVLPLIPEHTLIAERYEILSFLGSGGAAVVYSAMDHLLARRVALKILRGDRSTPMAAARLRREVALAHQIANDHVVRLFDIGESDRGLFVTMELIEGEPLRDRIARSPLPIAEALDMALAILEGLAAVHRAGIVHRDVKPSNVMVDSDRNVKLTDLGLARTFEADEERVTHTDAVVGTMEYLAPEQALGQRVDARTDLYAFGVLLFECLTGELPFGERSSVGAILAHVRERPRDVRQVRRDVPRWLALVIRKLLEKQPARRYQSASDVIEAIQRKRAPLNWRMIGGAAAATAVMAITFLGVRLSADRQPHVELIASGDSAIRAVNEEGTTLWMRKGVPRSAATILRNRRHDLVALFPHGMGMQPAADRSLLQLVDPVTGSVVRSLRLPYADQEFGKFAAEFGLIECKSVDLNHDGDDELVATFVHTYYPSYNVYFDPRMGEARILMFSSGHHRLVGQVDVNGDGRDELLIAGINNRMGWHMGIAAINVPSSSEAGVQSMAMIASTPDIHEAWGRDQTLLWYTLLPPGYAFAGSPLIDAGKRVITLPYSSRDVVKVGFDGFIVDGKPHGATDTRTRSRLEAYRALREAQGLGRGTYLQQAVEAADESVRLAATAEDPFLNEWAVRVHGRLLAQAGKGEEALRLLSDRSIPAEVRPDFRFELATEFHLRGELERAVDLYRRGAYEKERVLSGRLRYEFVEGAVLALCELQRWSDAAAVAAEFSSGSMSGDGVANINYVKLRTNSDFTPWPAYEPPTDFARYLKLEDRARSSRAAREVLGEVEAEIARNGGYRGALESLAGELHRRLGERDESVRLARAAVTWIEAERPTSPFARAHAPFVSARARAAGVM